MNSAKRMVHIQLALHLTQKELGALVGKDAILRAAAVAGGASPTAVEAIVEATFRRAAHAGVEAGAVASAMSARKQGR